MHYTFKNTYKGCNSINLSIIKSEIAYCFKPKLKTVVLSIFLVGKLPNVTLLDINSLS